MNGGGGGGAKNGDFSLRVLKTIELDPKPLSPKGISLELSPVDRAATAKEEEDGVTTTTTTTNVRLVVLCGERVSAKGSQQLQKKKQQQQQAAFAAPPVSLSASSVASFDVSLLTFDCDCVVTAALTTSSAGACAAAVEAGEIPG